MNLLMGVMMFGLVWVVLVGLVLHGYRAARRKKRRDAIEAALLRRQKEQEERGW